MKTYAGKIKPGATQNVKAPNSGRKATKGNEIKRGNDLRTTDTRTKKSK